MTTSDTTGRPIAWRKATPRGRVEAWLSGRLAGAAGFVASCSSHYYGLTVPSAIRGPCRSTSSWRWGPNDAGPNVGALLFLFGGVASVAVVAAMGVARGCLRPAPRAWGGGRRLVVHVDRIDDPRGHVRDRGSRWNGLLVQAATVGVVVIGNVVVAATARAGNASGGYEVATAQARRAVWAPSRCQAPAPSRG